jgi:anti-sigma B factor antagonist
MEYQIEKLEDVLVISLQGRLLGEHQTLTLLEEIEEQIAMNLTHIVVDLGKLDYINSNGLNFLLTVLTKTRKEDGETVLCNISETIQQLLITTKLKAFFTLVDDRDAALIYFRREKASS